MLGPQRRKGVTKGKEGEDKVRGKYGGVSEQTGETPD